MRGISHVEKKSFENDFRHATIPKSDLPRLKKKVLKMHKKFPKNLRVVEKRLQKFVVHSIGLHFQNR